MIRETVYCDRCGKEDASGHGFHLCRKYFLGRLSDYFKKSNDFLIDLCPDCYDSLEEWMEAGKIDKGENEEV